MLGSVKYRPLTVPDDEEEAADDEDDEEDDSAEEGKFTMCSK